MRVTKDMVLLEISDVDDKLLEFFNNKPNINARKLTVKELTELRDAFKTIYKLFSKCAIKKQRG